MIPDFPIDIRIRLTELNFFFCCFLTLLIFCPVGWVSFTETSQQFRKLAKSGRNKKKIQFCQYYSYVNRKIWYHQIWISNNLGFIPNPDLKLFYRSCLRQWQLCLDQFLNRPLLMAKELPSPKIPHHQLVQILLQMLQILLFPVIFHQKSTQLSILQ